MEELLLLRDLLTVFAVSAATVFAFHRLQIPGIVGLLAAGVMVGPYGLRLVQDVERVEILAEIGVVVLLFTVGLEFSLSRLLKSWHIMLFVGAPQLLGTGLVAVLATRWQLGGWGPAIFAGMLVAMSSTAVVLKLISERGELSTPHARVAVAVLLLQDLLVTVCMVVLPWLAGEVGEGQNPALQIAVGLLVVAAILIAIRFVIPPLLYQVLKTRDRQLFLLAIVVVCLGATYLTASFGLSLALGAFLAGLALSDSEYAQQTLAEALPFRDTLSNLFFVSVGMLLDIRFVLDNLGLISITVAAVLALKFSVVAFPMVAFGFPLRTSILAGMALCQVGEFSFVLANRGVDELGLMGQRNYELFLAAAVVTMALTPAALALGGRLADRLAPYFPSPRRKLPAADEQASIGPLRDHVIIAGYGLNGRNLARVLRDLELPYVVLEMNPSTVRTFKAQGENIYFGDCSQAHVLEHLGIDAARALVVAISDPELMRRTVRVARHLAPHSHIIVRTRYVSEVEELRRLGANEIIPEEFETSVEIFSRVLEQFQIARNVIIDLVERIRHDHYEVLRSEKPTASKMDLPLEVFGKTIFESYLLPADSPALGRTLAELNLRAATGATAIAVRRGEKTITNPPPDFRFAAQDVVTVMGDSPQLARAICLFDPPLES